MRQEVYVKFAEALQQKKADDRRQYIRGRLADVIQAQKMQKSAAGERVIAPLLSRLSRALLRARVKLSPKVNTSGWAKYDPRRLFLTKRPTTFTATNYKPVGGLANRAVGAANAYSAYGGPSGPIRAFGELERLGGVGETTRISPGKILAALGLTGGTAAIARKAMKGPKEAPQVDIPPALPAPANPEPPTQQVAEPTSPAQPAGGGSVEGNDFWDRLSADPRMQRVIASLTAAGAATQDKARDIMARIQAAHGLHVGLAGAGGLAAGAAGGYMVGAHGNKQPAKKKKRTDGDGSEVK